MASRESVTRSFGQDEKRLIADSQPLADLKAVAPTCPPPEIAVEFVTPDHITKYRFLPGIEIVDSRTILSCAPDCGPPGASSTWSGRSRSATGREL